MDMGSLCCLSRSYVGWVFLLGHVFIPVPDTIHIHDVTIPKTSKSSRFMSPYPNPHMYSSMCNLV